VNNADNLALLGRVMGGLVVVLVLIGLAARVARRTRGNTGTSGLRVLDRVGLSREANLAVVEVGNRMLLLGVTAQGVTMLADLEPAPAAEPAVESPSEPVDFDREFDREQGTEPEFVDVDEPAVPVGIALDQYPDLASALRAAGRTTESSSTAATSAVQMAANRNHGSGLALSRTTAPTTSVPRTRAAARAEARSATVPTPVARTPVAPAPRGRLSLRRSASTPKIISPQGNVQASGSVLSPQTWRQGINALRDLTVRRG
jgi:flagellar biosynthetic protein FliO